MFNQKRTLNFCDQFQLFQDLNLTIIPITIKEKRQYHRYVEEEPDESKIEDIFDQMGNANDSKKPLNQSVNQSLNDDWNSFYVLKLNQLKQERLDLNHNELTKLISKEWRQSKINAKKLGLPIPIQRNSRSKKKKDKKIINKLSKQKQQYSQNEKRPSNRQIIETLKNAKFKIIINEQSHELFGNTIIEAILDNSNLIYLLDNHNQFSQLDTSSEQSGFICLKDNLSEDDNIVIQNKLNSYL